MEKKQKRIVAYVTETYFPETIECVNYVNYAFGWVTMETVLIRSDRQSCLQSLADLRNRNGAFKLLVSLQQRGKDVFCIRSKTPEGRALLAAQCRELVEKFDLDGIDLDWEYPGIDLSTGEENCETCREDFIALLEAIRKELGSEKLLTIACGATPFSHRHTDFVRAGQLLDFINIMGYDHNWGKFGQAHHSNLFPSEDGIGDHSFSTSWCVESLLQQGIPAEKLILGLPFYGYVKGKGAEGALSYQQILDMLQEEDCELAFDEAARQSYVKQQGEFTVAFDDPRTIQEKAAYVKAMGLGGLMYWSYAHDDAQGTLRHAVWDALD